MDLLWLHTSVQHNGEEGGPVVVVGSAGQHLAAETPGRGKPKIGRAKRGKVAQSGFFSGVDEKSYPFFVRKLGGWKKVWAVHFHSSSADPAERKKVLLTRGRGDRPQLDPWDETTRVCVCVHRWERTAM